MTDSSTIESHLREHRRFAPPEAFRATANMADAAIYDKAAADPEAFWAERARELDWAREWDSVLEWDAPYAKWFVGGRLNASANALDRHLAADRADKVALHWEGEPGDQRALTYGELHALVCRFANALTEMGVKKGDRVSLYLPMVPELVVAMLACARIGAPHNVVFAGFSPAALAHRMDDAGSRVLITCDGYFRAGKALYQKERADEAVERTESTTVDRVVVVRRFASDSKEGAREVPWTAGRDLWFDDVVEAASAEHVATPMESEDMLFMMYTSGSTGKPKGIVHSTGGYLTGVQATSRWVLDLKPEDTYWCMADIGWITGHSYIVYGPLLVGATQVMFEGAPTYPDPGRPWEIVERYSVSVFYTAPTAIRAFMKTGASYPRGADLGSLRLLGTVGEPINPEAWMWYHEEVGGKRCPIVDTWWQTETGMHMITPLPGLTTLKPGSATRAFPGIDAAILDDDGKEVPPGTGGFLAIRRPWPSMLRGIWGDDDRYRKQYWSRWGGRFYEAGDGAQRDADGDFWIMGRLDDVLNVAGHRLSTMEIESALVAHEAVAEAAVTGAPDLVKGVVPVAFVILEASARADAALRTALDDTIVREIGKIARPKHVVFAPDLPKTRSGKIMRRLLGDIVHGRPLGDTTTLADPDVPAHLKDLYDSLLAAKDGASSSA